MKKVFLISIGSELLKGETVNTNLVFLGEALFDLGFPLVGERTVPDDPGEIKLALAEALKVADCVITCGGLGPTFDDITQEVLTKILGKSAAIDNRLGSAFGCVYHSGTKRVIALPGVPREFETMLREEVIPKFFTDRSKTASLTAKAIAISEVDFLKRLGSLPSPDRIECGIYPQVGEVRFTARILKHSRESDRDFKELETRIRLRLKGHLYSMKKEETFEEVLGKLLKKKRITVAVAESCTGGTISRLLTDIPGSSDYFMGGVIAYSNRVKESLLDVPRKIIRSSGAVSREVAVNLARNVQKKFKAAYGISVTGIAGPGGGNSEKPVGLVYMGVAGGGRIFTREFRFRGARERIRLLASKWALYLLWHRIKFGRF